MIYYNLKISKLNTFEVKISTMKKHKLYCYFKAFTGFIKTFSKLLLILVVLSTKTTSSQYLSDSIFKEYVKIHSEELDALEYLYSKFEGKPSYAEIMNYYNKLSMHYIKNRDFETSLDFVYKSSNIENQVSDSVLIVRSWLMSSYAYNRIGNLDSAIVYAKKVNAYSKRNDEIALQRSALTSLASIANQNKHYNDAILMYKKAHELSRVSKNIKQYASDQYNLGLTYMYLGIYDSCMIWLDSAIYYANMFNRRDILLISYGTKSDCYHAIDSISAWKKWLMEANRLAIELGNDQFLAMGYSSLMSNSHKNGDHSKAIKYGSRADSLLKLLPFKALQLRLDSLLYLSYKYTGDYSKALERLENYYLERVKLLNEKQKSQINKLHVEFEVEKMDLNIRNLKLEISDNKKRNIINVFIIILLLLIVITLLVFRVLKNKYVGFLFQKEKKLNKVFLNGRSKLRFLKNIDNNNSVNQKKDENIIRERKQLLYNMLDLIENSKLYLDPLLNQDKIIRLLGTNKNYLHEAISMHASENFRTIINQYRINESKKYIENRIINGEKISLSLIYEQVGFNSSASFYRVFKTDTGLNPHQYIREFKKTLNP